MSSEGPSEGEALGSREPLGGVSLYLVCTTYVSGLQGSLLPCDNMLFVLDDLRCKRNDTDTATETEEWRDPKKD